MLFPPSSANLPKTPGKEARWGSVQASIHIMKGKRPGVFAPTGALRQTATIKETQMPRLQLPGLILILSLAFFPACKADSPKPEAQLAFSALIERSKEQYLKADTDFKKSEAVKEFQTALAKAYEADPGFADWVCQVSQVRVEDLLISGPIAILTVDCGTFDLFNLDTAVVGKPDHAVTEGTPAYNLVTGLGKGDLILVSGNFVKDSDSGIKEASVTEAGKLTHPEFVVRFTNIARPK